MADQIGSLPAPYRTPWGCYWPTSNLPDYSPPVPPGGNYPHWDAPHNIGHWDDGASKWDQPPSELV